MKTPWLILDTASKSTSLVSGVRHEEEKYPALCPLSMNKSKDGFITGIHRHSRISPKCVLEPEQKMKSERQRQEKVNPRVTKLSCTGHLWEGWSTNSFHPPPPTPNVLYGKNNYNPPSAGEQL